MTASVSGQPAGQWDFNSGNLNATVGSLTLNFQGNAQGGTAFNTTTGFGLPDVAGAPANVMRFNAFTFPDGYVMTTPPAPGSGSFINDWTLVLDVLYPTESNGQWRPLIDLDKGVINPDAEFFVSNGNGLGIGQYDGTVSPNTWHRLGIVVDRTAGFIRKYIDGIEVGTQSMDQMTDGELDGRWAMEANSTAVLLADNDGEAALGYVNSLQVYTQPLSKGQMAALGGATADGLPTTLPQVSSYFERWIPRNKFVLGNPDIGAVIVPGDSTITDVVLKIDDVAQTGVTQTPNGEFLTILKTAAGPFGVGTTHTVELSYTDSVGGPKSYTRTFEVAVLVQDFDSVVLGPNVTEDMGNPRDAVWTDDPFNGWSIDDSQMQGSVDDPNLGMEEWEGWSVADYVWWATVAGDQRRSEFSKAFGNVAVADPDEWDDRGNAKGTYGYFNSFLNSPAINLTGLAPNSVGLSFDSSWRPEAFDDAGPDGQQSNNQTAVVTVTYDGGQPIEVLRWDSDPASAFYKDDNSVNDSVSLLLNNPAGATSMTLSFALLNSGNDWWWAVDNVAVTAGAVPPFISSQPANLQVAEGGEAVFSVTATGTEPFEYQWFKRTDSDPVEIAGATGSTLTLSGVTLADAGRYFVRITNPGGTVDSNDAVLTVQLAAASQVLFVEDFNSLALGPNVDEALAGANVWTKTGPTGWVIDDSGVPGAGTANDGVTEWAGWSFADRAWWAQTAGNQRRAEFAKGTGAVAIADGDEWDDLPRESGQMTTYLTTPGISLQGVKAGTVILQFDSSWRPEVPQKANVQVAFDGGALVEVLRFESDEASPNYKDDNSVNDTLTVAINNPPGASTMVVRFGYLDAGNNWWWAIDNIQVTGEPAPLFFEDFNSLALGPNVDEALAGANVWTKTGPAGWVIDDSGVPGAGTANDGVTEWAGWSFADRAWWAQTAGNQRRAEFTKGTGAVAIADGDEWDDAPREAGQMATYLSTRAIDISGAGANTLVLKFDSSWRPEVAQKANVRVAYDGGAPVEVLRFESDEASPHYKDDNSVNDTLTVPLNNPAGAASMVITFGYFDAGNNWWWAIDNVEVFVGSVAAPELSVQREANGDLTLQWGGTAVLQSTTSIGGQWDEESGATSPFTVTPSGPSRKYRLVQP